MALHHGQRRREREEEFPRAYMPLIPYQGRHQQRTSLKVRAPTNFHLSSDEGVQKSPKI